MNLKEAFRFQNKLQSMMADAQSILGNNGNISIFENHRLEIETAYGKSLTWVSQDGVRACRIYDKLEGVSITNEEDWDAMVSFHANKAKALLTIVQPFLT